MSQSTFLATMVIMQATRLDIVSRLRILAKAIEDSSSENQFISIYLEPIERRKVEGKKVHLFSIEAVSLADIGEVE